MKTFKYEQRADELAAFRRLEAQLRDILAELNPLGDYRLELEGGEDEHIPRFTSLNGPGGESVNVRPIGGAWDDMLDGPRLEIWGSMPTGFYGSGHTTITVSRSRSPRAIALEIHRRLMPPYLEQYRKGVEWVRKAKADRAARDRAGERLAATCKGGHFTPGSQSVWLPGGASARIDTADSVMLSMSGLTVEMAEAILKGYYIFKEQQRSAKDAA